MGESATQYQVAGAATGGAGVGLEDRRSSGSGQVSGLATSTYGDVTGRAVVDTGSHDGRQAVANPRPRAREAPTESGRAQATPSQRDLIRRMVKKAVDFADDMIRSAEADEPVELSNAGFDLWRCLKDLWALRKHREPNWGDLLNMLQGAVAGETYEAFTAERCRLIRRVLFDHLKPWIVEDEDVALAIELVERAGLDPWKGISSSPVSKPELRPEIQRIVERNWPRDEEALRHLGQ